MVTPPHLVNSNDGDVIEASASKTIRDQSMDWIAGLLILVMITGHISQESGHSLRWYALGGYSWFYFFMPWFFFKSGMFERGGTIHMSKILKGLIIPFIFFTLAGYFIWSLQYLAEHEWSFRWIAGATLMYLYAAGSFPGNGPLWFLEALIIARMLFPLFVRMHFNNWWIMMFAFGIAFIYVFLLRTYNDGNYLMMAIPQGFLALSCYAAGYLFKRLQYNMWVAGAGIIIYLAIVLLKVPTIPFAQVGMTAPMESWLLFLPSSLAGIVTWNYVVRLMPSWFFRVFPLGYLGRNSMTYYCGHFIIITTLVYLYEVKGVSLFGLPLVWAMVVSCAVILPVADVLLRRYLPWAVGIKAKNRREKDIETSYDPLT